MDKKKIKNFNIENIIWLIIYILPLLIIVARIFSNFHNTSNAITIDSILTEFRNMISFSDNTFVSNLSDFIVNTFGLTYSTFVDVLVSAICYVVLIKLLYLVYKFITLLIDIVIKYFKKWSD